MRKNKKHPTIFDNLEECLQMKCGIDTLTIRTPQTVFFDPAGQLIVPDGEIVKDTGRKEGYTKLFFNPNKFIGVRKGYDKGRGYEIYSFSEFLVAMESFLIMYGIEDYYFERIDYRFDSQIDFEQVRKVNSAIILSCYPSRTNKWENRDMLTGERRNNYFQSRVAEIESYNKRIQAPDEDISSRLELRTKGQHAPRKQLSLEERPVKFARKWEKLLTGCVVNYPAVLENINQHLMNDWEKGVLSGKYTSKSDFLRQNEGRIFTRGQLTKLLALMGAKNPTKAQYKFVSQNKGMFHFVEKSDLKHYADYLKEKMEVFLSQ